jgi:putative ABC transport system permease protein
MFETWLQDARFAVRLLWKSPLFTATAALSLAIGIGANATIFSVGSALLLRPMPGISGTDRLVDVGRTRGNDEFDTVSYPNYKDLRDRSTSYTGLYAYLIEPSPVSLGGHGEAERIYGSLVTANYFDVLGTRPLLGRLLRPEDDSAIGANPVVVLSYDLWTRRFGSNEGIVGTQVNLNGFPFTVVGVAPRGFQGTTLLKGDVWIPLSMVTYARPSLPETMFASRRSTWLFMGGRLKDGVSIEQANAELGAVGGALAQEFPETNAEMRFKAHGLAVVPGLTRIIAGFVGLLMGIVTLLLLIACVNLAGMLLARGASRSREMAVRLAIGAGQGRIVRQLLTETAVLFVIGAAGGLVLSRWLTSMLLNVLPQLPVPLFVEITTDWRVVLFTAGTALVAAVLCGLAPALQARRTSLVPALKTDSLDGQTSRLRLRNIFVVGQVTLSLVLVIAAGLFMRALGHAASTPTGFDHRDIDVIELDLSLARYEADQGRVFARELLDRARQLPGVQSAALAVDLPLDGGNMGFGRLTVPGAPGADRDGNIEADWNVVEPGLFRTLGMRLAKGRDFTEADRAGTQPVIIVNEAFARAAWGDADPLGRQIAGDQVGPSNQRQSYVVVGVAADARFRSLGEAPRPYVLVAFAQLYHARINVLVKHSGTSAIGEVRSLVRSMNPNLPVTVAMSLDDVTALGTIPQRIAGAIAGTLGVVGLLLAAMGIFGVTAYAVNRRTREIGIRVALGAGQQQVMRLLLIQGLRLAAIGIVLGTLIAAAASQLLGSLLLGVGGLDPLTFGGAALIFALVAITATYIPARRALTVDPMVALRNE